MDFADDRAAATEDPAIARPVADLHAFPAGRLAPRGVDLEIAVLVVLVIGDDRPPGVIETEFAVHVDQSAFWRHGVHNLAGLQGDGQCERFAGGVGPRHKIIAARVAQIVVAGAVRRVAPDPDHVKASIRPKARHTRIGVHLAESTHQRRGEQPRPLACFLVIDVIEIVAAATAAVAVAEDQAARFIAQKNRIGHALLAVAGHRQLLQRRRVERLRAAEIDQRHAVHVAGKVQVAGAVEYHGHIVVRIPAQRRGQLGDRPVCRVQRALRHRHPPLCVVVGGELVRRVRQQAEPDRVRRPHRLEIQFDGVRRLRHAEQHPSPQKIFHARSVAAAQRFPRIGKQAVCFFQALEKNQDAFPRLGKVQRGGRGVRRATAAGGRPA